MKLNETPVRTSRNFNINNIKLENVFIPKKNNDFKNIEMINESSKNNVKEIDEICELTYGISSDFTQNVNRDANKKLQINFNSKTEKKLQINYDFDEDNPNLVEHIEVVANENSKATLVLKYESKENLEYFHNAVLKLRAKNSAKINVIIINLLNVVSNNFMAIENILEENAKVKYTIVDFGGKNSITNYYANLVGKSSDNRLNTIYLGRENQLFDLNYIGELRGEKSNVNIEVQGALKDISKKHFKGTIDFKKGCKKATGDENENCLLLSDTAKSLALPMLLCSEEEVEGNHSSSSGKIGEKELFYIMSRGFSLKEAQKLMVKANFNQILENVKDKELKEKILNEIDERLE